MNEPYTAKWQKNIENNFFFSWITFYSTLYKIISSLSQLLAAIDNDFVEFWLNKCGLNVRFTHYILMTSIKFRPYDYLFNQILIFLIFKSYNQSKILIHYIPQSSRNSFRLTCCIFFLLIFLFFFLDNVITIDHLSIANLFIIYNSSLGIISKKIKYEN